MDVVRVAAFVGPGLRGNPAGVVLVDEELPAARRQELATAIGLPATAFPVPRADGGFDLRWHGPTEELAFCGHGTLAAAHVLWDGGRAPRAELAFATPAGELRARPAGEAVELDLPALPLVDEPVPDGLVEALGVDALTVARGALDALVEVATPEQVAAARPDLGGARRAAPARRAADGARRPGRRRLHVALLLPRGRHRRGPGDGLRALPARPLVGGAAGPRRAARPPGVGARRRADATACGASGCCWRGLVAAGAG